MSREVFLPETLDQLWNLWTCHPQADLMAGGTDLLVKLDLGSVNPPVLIGLERLPELKRLEEHGRQVFLGAGLTHTELLDTPLVQRRLPILIQALEVLASPPIRHMGTLGGNIITASPAGDTLPPLYCLEAEVELRRPDGTRRLPITEFILGPGRTALDHMEILAGVWVRGAEEYNVQHFEKVGQRKALAIAVVSLAVLLRVSATNHIEAARLAWGSVGPKVVTSSRVEAALMEKPLTLETLKAASLLAQAAVAPIDDLRATAAYRREVAGRLLLRLIKLSTGATGGI